MIENNLLKTNFLGKDGFRWWIGQIAPEDAQGDQLNEIGNAWGCRLKVRIYGYHPPNETELANDDLPWAQVLLSPQGGSGKANRARSLRISPGDVVMGFFLDGDDAQLPVIMGIFANNPEYYGGSDEYTSPFEPFTGYTSKIKPNTTFIAKNESGSSSKDSQKSPTFVTKELEEKLNEALKKGEAQLNQLVDSGELQKRLSEASNQAKQLLESGKLQTGLSETKDIVEGLKKKYGFPTTQAFSAIGQKIIFAGGGEGQDTNSKAFNNIKTTLENTLQTVNSATFKNTFKGIFDGADQIVSASKGMISDMVGTTFDSLSPELNSGLHKQYKDVFGDVLNKTGNIALAKKAAQNAQLSMVGPILKIQDSMPCIVKNITDKLKLDVANLLTDFVNNVENFTDCIGDQFIGALFNDIIKGINTELEDGLKGVSEIFPDANIEGLLRDKAEGILGIAEIFDDCDVQNADFSGKINGFLLGIGPLNVNLENIAGNILSVANAAQELKEAAASPGGVIGNLGLFDFMRPDVSTPGFSSTLSDCYTGPPLNCSGIKINLFGGGGSGATGSPILGSIISDTFAVQTASLIGINLTSGGSGYTSAPFVEITDTCRNGYGAVARAVIDYDPSSPTFQQVTDVYVVSSGTNYPVIEPEDEEDSYTGVHTVDHVVVVDEGQNYTQNDTVVDDKGNVYDMFLDEQGRILNVIPPDPRTNNLEPYTTLPQLEVISNTGTGALLKAQLTPRPIYQGEVKQVIDCISPRNTNIVGYINGEPYYGSFHVHPTTGAKMVGAAHTTSPHAIIYDTPQESRTSRSSVTTSTSYTTVSSSVQTNVSSTTTQTTTSSTPQTDPVDTSSQQTSGQSYTPPNNNNTGSSGSSGSGGSGSSGGGGYGGGY